MSRILSRVGGVLRLVTTLGCVSSIAHAWDYGDGRHGSFVLTMSTTIEQLYLSVRLQSDPPVYNPSDSRAVPSFRNFTITNNSVLTATLWNGNNFVGRIECSVQGVLAIDAGSSISAKGLGFGGGGAGQPGAGPGSGGGGSTYSPRPGTTGYRSGGGGGYGSAGGAGTNSGGAGGGVYGAALETLFMSSGGGGGAEGAAGRAGGGVIVINAGRLRVDGQLHAGGSDGLTEYYPGGGSGGSGGGSGGSILLRVISVALGNVSAAGGGGGSDRYGNPAGGAGGVAWIRIEYSAGVPGATSPAASTLDNSGSDMDGDGIRDNVEWGPT
ncbi:MAG: hypothetical protein HY736_19305 [Verrucomicrobia bacterium]|nr:hypothetical protein [Verrucomicrobiota bacterium]